MKRFCTFAIGLAAWLSAGCVSTLNPLYSKDVAAQDPAMEGIWFLEPDSPLAGAGRQWQSVSISKSSGDGDLGGYSLTFDTPESSKTYAAQLVELAGRKYLDIYAPNEAVNPDAIPVHNIVRVSVAQGRLALALLDKQKVQQILDLDEPALPVAQIGERLVFTGSTAKLQAFFAKYGDRLFAAERTFHKRAAKVAAE